MKKDNLGTLAKRNIIRRECLVVTIFLSILIAVILLVLLLVWLRYDYVHGLQELRNQAEPFKPLTHNGSLELLTTGENFFDVFLSDVRGASHHVHILFYIFRDDAIGKRVIDQLMKKAEDGVDVRLLIDRFGCKLKRSSRKKLEKAGVHFVYSDKPKGPYWFFSLNKRNHRKIAVIDGHTAYIGGYNVGDEYLGRDPTFGFWRDFHLKLTGEGVQEVQRQYVSDWQRATGKAIEGQAYYPVLSEGPHRFRLLGTNGVYLEETLLPLIKEAKTQILLGTPYYVPTKRLQKAVIEAVKRGVDVQVLLPEKADHPLIKHAATPFLIEIIKAGVRVFHYYRGFYHVKAMVVDGKHCLTGTANFDRRSFHLNHEMSCYIEGEAFSKEVYDVLEHDFSISTRVSLETLKKRSLLDRGKERVAMVIVDLF
ncbi:cardiolipin synthase [Shouchella shacheensis]|uniref:cardiolipin synthase n=1 Tax=Shouchella shacheensis TaxID=1649580 RepID=UPI00073FD30C|nr:cardiolipin synthase [Shouchella shacheensis]